MQITQEGVQKRTDRIDTEQGWALAGSSLSEGCITMYVLFLHSMAGTHIVCIIETKVGTARFGLHLRGGGRAFGQRNGGGFRIEEWGLVRREVRES